MSYKAQNSTLYEVNESLSIYLKKIGNTSKKFSFSDFFEDKMLVIKAIHNGLPYKLFDQIKILSPFSDKDWAQYLDLSLKTLHRYREDVNFSFRPIHTEKIIEIAEVTSFGLEVFDSSEQFYLWLNTASFALNNMKPADLLMNSYGKELVMAELTRIEYGIFA